MFVITDLNGGGAERVMLSVLRHLDSARFAPSIFLLRRAGKYWDDVPPGIPIHWGIDGARRIIFRSWTVLRKITRLAKQSDVIVGALEQLPSYFAYAASVLAGKPAMAWVHTDLRRHLPLQGNRAAHRFIIKKLYPHFRKVVFPSQNAREGLRSIAPLNDRDCEVIQNPSDIRLIVSRSTENLPVQAVTIFSKPTIVGVGSLDNAIKGFDLLVQAHGMAKSDGCDHNLVILGEGPDYNALLEMAERLGVANSTFLLGFQSNPYPFILAATALAVPSRFEAFGMVVTEALTLGTPVIVASTALGALEVIEQGIYGGVFLGGNVRALAASIREIVGNPALRAIYAQRGLARAQFFGADQVVGKWEDVLYKVAYGRPQRKAID